MTLRELRDDAARMLSSVAADNAPEQKDEGIARFMADTLLCAVLHTDRASLLLRYHEPADPAVQQALFSALEQKKQGVPLQYILGEWDFYGRPFYCGEGCLIPRADTELAVETALGFLPGNGCVLDLCTGSGCIVETLLLEKPHATGIGVDISPEALHYASRNASRHELEERLTLTEADLYTYVPDRFFDVIVSNPPYIRSCDMASLSAEVKREPSIALDGGEDGLDFYKVIIERFTECLLPGGAFVFEAGFDTAAGVKSLLDGAGFAGTRILKDYGGNDRVVIGKRLE